jgi:hypothetical protein
MTANRPTDAWMPLDGSVVMYESGRLLHGRIIDMTASTLRIRCAPGYSLHALLGAPLELEIRLDRWGEQRRVSGCAAQVRSDRDLVIVIDVEELPCAGGMN